MHACNHSHQTLIHKFELCLESSHLLIIDHVSRNATLFKCLFTWTFISQQKTKAIKKNCSFVALFVILKFYLFLCFSFSLLIQNTRAGFIGKILVWWLMLDFTCEWNILSTNRWLLKLRQRAALILSFQFYWVKFSELMTATIETFEWLRLVRSSSRLVPFGASFSASKKS